MSAKPNSDAWTRAVTAKSGTFAAGVTGHAYHDRLTRLLCGMEEVLDECSTWVPHPTWWRRWLGQRKRVVDRAAYFDAVQALPERLNTRS